MKAYGKIKIFNDPVHGFIEVPKGILTDLIDHPIFQRLRYIRQLALSSLVYPGAVHTRFHHALGAMHLTAQALDVLTSKEVEISEAEREATLIAILLHDIGHGPFSHALEQELIRGVKHEELSKQLMDLLNEEFQNKLSLAIEIFHGRYPKWFLHQLVSSQLDMDRMDYLLRDSFFTGVTEGVVGADRLTKTLDVRDNQLVVEEKGIYSVEKFIVARRLMYWQVYLHKAALAAEKMLVGIIRRARELAIAGKLHWYNSALEYFLKRAKVSISTEMLQHFVSLDDQDIL
ncbi:MAG: HD domain-containing protein, partial [Bacteroidia bacterium]|nr:HD domain-containing protein [Bacteroidia bacterium]